MRSSSKIRNLRFRFDYHLLRSILLASEDKPKLLADPQARVVRRVTSSKSRACREGHTSGLCRWLFSVARPIGDVESLKSLHRYNVVKTPAVGVLAVWKGPAAFKTTNALVSIRAD
jgi:hypothetical protein